MKNGITIGLGYNTDGKRINWHDVGVITVDDIKRIISVYAFGKSSIWTDIFVFQGKRTEIVIKNVKYNKKNDTYSIYFNDNINKIDKNWHEKIYATFVEHPLVSQFENINIYKKNKQTKDEQQLVRDFKLLNKMCDAIARFKTKTFDIIDFEFKMEMKQQIFIEIQNLVNKMDQIEKEKRIVNNLEKDIKFDENEVKIVKIKDLLIEKERAKCECQVKKLLDDCMGLKENFENRRKEVEGNISKLGEIEKIESSMNSQVVQGYEKEKEKEMETQFQMVVSKGMELLNVDIQYIPTINTILESISMSVSMDSNNAFYNELCVVSGKHGILLTKLLLLNAKANCEKMIQIMLFSCLSGRTIGMVLDTGDGVCADDHLICKVGFFIIDDGG